MKLQPESAESALTASEELHVRAALCSEIDTWACFMDSLT